MPRPRPQSVHRLIASALTGAAVLALTVMLGLPAASAADSLATERTSHPVTGQVRADAPAPRPILPSQGGQLDDPLGGTPPAGSSANQPKNTAPRLSPGSGSTPGILGWLGIAALLVVSLMLTGVAFTTLAWMLHAWRTPEHLLATRFGIRRDDRKPLRFSLLVPARHEEAVLGQTLDQLSALDYDDLEVVAIVGDDDPGTAAVALAAAKRHPGRVSVVTDSSIPKNKPKALNTALRMVTGDVVGVFDAEDEVHPELVTHVDGRFHQTDADIVQGGVQLMNVHTTWWSMRNCLEYYFWFRSRLHFHADQRFIPLGGNTVFVRTALLRDVGGWDPECLAEDCEIGVRLSTRGAKVAVAYDPELVTREETPGTLPSLIKQRTRWNQGFLQVLGKGVWRELPTRRQRLLARYTLSMPFLQAFTGVMIPISIALVLLARVPTWVSLVTFLPLVPTAVTLAVEAAGLSEFGRAYAVKVRARDYAVLIIGTFPYQVLLAGAAVRAAWRQKQGQRGWEKTEHTNLHRQGNHEGALRSERPVAGAAVAPAGPWRVRSLSTDTDVTDVRDQQRKAAS